MTARTQAATKSWPTLTVTNEERTAGVLVLIAFAIVVLMLLFFR
jgi:hypothetical protein